MLRALLVACILLQALVAQAVHPVQAGVHAPGSSAAERQSAGPASARASPVDVQPGAWPALIATEAGAFLLVGSYLGSAMTAVAVPLGSSIGCPTAAPLGGGKPVECPPAPKMDALYVPLIGPFAYLLDRSRPKSPAVDDWVKAFGLAQAVGIVAIGAGVLMAIRWRHEHEISPPPVTVVPEFNGSSGAVALVLRF